MPERTNREIHDVSHSWDDNLRRFKDSSLKVCSDALDGRILALHTSAESVDTDPSGEGRALVHTFSYLIVFPSLVTTSVVTVTFTLHFVVLPLSVHSSSSSPFILSVPSSVLPNKVRCASPSLLNSAVTKPPACAASHFPELFAGRSAGSGDELPSEG